MTDEMIEVIVICPFENVRIYNCDRDCIFYRDYCGCDKKLKMKVSLSQLHALGFIKKEDAVKYVKIDREKTCNQRSILVEDNMNNSIYTMEEKGAYDCGVNDMLGWININNPIKLKAEMSKESEVGK